MHKHISAQAPDSVTVHGPSVHSVPPHWSEDLRSILETTPDPSLCFGKKRSFQNSSQAPTVHMPLGPSKAFFSLRKHPSKPSLWLCPPACLILHTPGLVTALVSALTLYSPRKICVAHSGSLGFDSVVSLWRPSLTTVQVSVPFPCPQPVPSSPSCCIASFWV